MTTKYVRTTDIIEAHRWYKNGDHPRDYDTDEIGFADRPDGTQAMVTFTGEHRKANNWEGSVVRYYRHPEVPSDMVCAVCHHTMHNHGWIDSGGEGRIVCPGDYVITSGEDFIPMHPEAFDATHRALVVLE